MHVDGYSHAPLRRAAHGAGLSLRHAVSAAAFLAQLPHRSHAACALSQLSQHSQLRLADRIHYNRYFMRIMHEQAQQNLHLPPDVWEQFSPRLRQMMGVSSFDHRPSL